MVTKLTKPIATKLTKNISVAIHADTEDRVIMLINVKQHHEVKKH